MARLALGLDFGTGSVRALLVDLDTGAEVGRGEAPYAHGQGGVITDPGDADLARQVPGDYLDGMRRAVPQALASAGAPAIAVVGVGVDATGSTPIPVDARNVPLAERFGLAEPAALAWLWKDHTAHAEAAEITALLGAAWPQALARCGGAYGAEWLWAKALHCARRAPKVCAAAAAFVELSDWIPAWLVGAEDPVALPRNACAAGHKGLYGRDLGGWPTAELLARLSPELARLRQSFGEEVRFAGERFGSLTTLAAEQLGLAPGTAVAVGALDAHLGAVGAGIQEGDVVKVLGTSSCDLAIARLPKMPAIDGLSGVVDGSIVPGWVGFEAGQSAVGDIFQSTARLVGRDLDTLTKGAARLAAGESGLIALDWQHGNRCVLARPDLSGLVVGLSLQTTDAELYRAMLEASAFGARVILERMVTAGVPVRRVIAGGGIASKSPLLLQILADVLGRPVQVAGSSETCALGAAVCGAVAAGAFADLPAAQRRLCPAPQQSFAPKPAAKARYEQLYSLYCQLHDGFGTHAGSNLGHVMPRLRELRLQTRAERPMP